MLGQERGMRAGGIRSCFDGSVQRRTTDAPTRLARASPRSLLPRALVYLVTLLTSTEILHWNARRGLRASTLTSLWCLITPSS